MEWICAIRSLEFQRIHGSPGSASMVVKEIAANNHVDESEEGKTFFIILKGKW